MFRAVSFVVYLTIVQGFLLDSNNPQTTGGNYLTVTEYQADLKHKFAEERLDTDKTLALLTKQIQQKFATLEQQVQDACKQNTTTDQSEPWKESFIQLQSNHSSLQKNYEDLLIKFAEQERKLNQIDYRTLEISKEFSSLEQLKSVQNLQDIHTFQVQMQTLMSETSSLKQKERARSQDFLALYNVTKSFEGHTNDQFSKLQHEQKLSMNQLEQRIQGTDMHVSDLEKRTNLTQVKMEHELLQLQETDTYVNIRNEHFKTESTIPQSGFPCIIQDLLRVSISKTTWVPNTIIKLDSVKIHTGIENITSYTSSGKFTCEKPGLILHISINQVLHCGCNNFNNEKY